MSRSVSLQEAADALGVHYMTAYRYVRTGRLAASRAGIEWRVDVRDIARLKAGPRPVHRGPGPRRWAVDQMADRLVAGDEKGVWGLVDAALASGADPTGVHLDLLCPALHAIGERWEGGLLSVADEHRASVVAQRVVGRLGPLFSRPGRSRGSVIVGAAPGERHALPGAILADELRGAGFDVVDLGADTPAESFVAAAADAPRLTAVLVGATTPRDRAVRRVVAAVRGVTDAAVLAGGAGLPDEDAALALGADGWSGLDARYAVEKVRGRPATPAAGPS